jgi:hypothetical protein
MYLYGAFFFLLVEQSVQMSFSSVSLPGNSLSENCSFSLLTFNAFHHTLRLYCNGQLPFHRPAQRITMSTQIAVAPAGIVLNNVHAARLRSVATDCGCPQSPELLHRAVFQ